MARRSSTGDCVVFVARTSRHQCSKNTKKYFVLTLLAVLTSGFILGNVLSVRADRVYTPAEVAAGLRWRPTAWVGRTVTVRGVLFTVGSGCGVGAACPLIPRWTQRPGNQTFAQWEELYTASRRNSPLILQVSGQSQPAWLSLRAQLLRIPIIGSLAARLTPLSPLATYRVRLFAPPSCPSSVLSNGLPCGPQGIRIP